MAQSLSDVTPSFCFSIFGCNSKFNHLDVISRWNMMKSLAAEEGNKIMGFSSDVDPRLLKAMQIQSFDINNEVNYEDIRKTTMDSLVDSNWPWFCIGRHLTSNKIELYDIVYIQDTVHVGT